MPDSLQDDERLELLGIPARRIRALVLQHGLESEVTRLEAMSMDELCFECIKQGLPFSILRSRIELSTCLASILVWNSLPSKELVQEAKRWDLPVTAATDPACTVNALALCLWESTCKARCIPVRSLRPDVSQALLSKASRLEASSYASVFSEYQRTLRRLHLPADPYGSKSHCIKFIIRSLVLEELDEEGFRLECQTHRITPTSTSFPFNRLQLAVEILSNEFLRKKWATRVEQLKTTAFEASLRIISRMNSLEHMSTDELRDEVKELSSELQDCIGCLNDTELLEALKALAVWSEQSVSDLEIACKKPGMSIEGLNEDDGRRFKLIALLLEKNSSNVSQDSTWPEKEETLLRIDLDESCASLLTSFNKLEDMTMEILRDQYLAETRLPLEASTLPADKDELLKRLRQVSSWKVLPYHELRNECSQLAVPSRPSSSELDEETKSQELVERLVLTRWADTWKSEGIPVDRLTNIGAAERFSTNLQYAKKLSIDSEVESLSKWFADVVGLPVDAFGTDTSLEEMLEQLKTVLIWKELSVDELREECLQASLSWRFDDEHEEEECTQLLGRLVVNHCAKAWKSAGLPVSRISTTRSAQHLLERWAKLEQMGLQELKQEYEKLGLPASSKAPKVLEILPRLRLVATWQALPIWELQKELVKLDQRYMESTRENVIKSEIVRLLVSASWGPEPTAEETDDYWKSKRQQQETDYIASKSEALKQVVAHFQTLGLPANANQDDLKRAYRRLVLQHHPDKNMDTSPSEAAENFRNISEAYEAIREFMKLKS